MTRATRPRLAPLPRGEWAEPERALLRGHLARADRYLSDNVDAPPIPPILGLLARHPHVGGPWLAFSGALIERGSLTDRDRELLILRVGSRVGNQYLLSQHLAMGEAAGLKPDELEALHNGDEAHAWSEPDRYLIRATDELIDSYILTDATWLGLSGSFDEQQLLEVLFVVGSYVCLGMVLNTVGLEPATKE